MPLKPSRLWPDSATILERSRGVFFAQWEELLQFRLTVLKTSGQDDIHDLRVASRRFRAALELFSAFAPKNSISAMRKSVRKLTRTLGSLRNVDEALLFFSSRTFSDDPAAHDLVQALTRMRAIDSDRIEKVLKSFDHCGLDRMVREVVAGINGDTVSEHNIISLLAYFSDTSIRLYLPIHQLMAISIAPEHRASRHAMRIAIKKWRYFLEIVAKILKSDYSAILEHLREYQSLLGHMNDIAEFTVLLGNLELPTDRREHVDSILAAEDARLLAAFAELVERKPLTYTFQI
jgi:CHAD domain-containing protein